LHSDSEAGRVRFAILFGVLLVGLGAAYGMVEIVHDLRVTEFQPFRMATIARGLALIALSGRCALLWARGDLTGRARVLVLVAGLTGDWAFVVAVAVELGASVGEWLALVPEWFSLDYATRLGKAGLIRVGSPLAAGVALLVLAAGLLFLVRHDLE